MFTNAYIDIRNHNYYVKKKWPDRRLDIKKYMAFLDKKEQIERAIAYGTFYEDSAKSFISLVHHAGFETRFKKIAKDSWFCMDVEIAVDVVKQLKFTSTIIIGSSNRTLAPLITWVRNQGVKVIVVGCGINTELKEACDGWIEIPEEVLEDETTTAA